MLKIRLKKFLLVLLIVGFWAGFCMYILEDVKDWLPLYWGETTDLSEIKYSDEMAEMYVSGTIDEVYVCYMEEYDGITLEAQNYVMKAGEENYIGIRIRDDFGKMERLAELSMTNLRGADNITELENAKFEIRGILKRMRGDSQYKYSCVEEEYQLSGNQKKEYLYYCIDVTDLEDDIIVPMLVIIVWSVVSAIFIWLTVRDGYHKDIQKYISRASSTEYAKEEVESFLKSAPHIYSIQYDRKFLCKRSGMNTMFIETPTIVRIYKETTVHRYKIFIPIYKSNELVLVTAEGKRRTIDFTREKQIDKVIEALRMVCPNARIGK